MQQKLKGAIVALAITSIVSIPVLAEPTAEDALDYRRAVMTALRGHIGASSMIVPSSMMATCRHRFSASSR